MSWLTVPVPALVLALVFSVFAGVVLPAVWSTQPARRKAAAAVLAQLLQTGRDVGGTRLSTLPSPPPADAAPAYHQRAHGEPRHPDNEA
ncbi:hypothetical protein StrepF001_12845 [Streptomyces sp. F001]|uniref:hypothetical protein n=1 Tax=Streptomyces sp. F001 TaxID=1510026 RepID=UPI00101E4B0C|nr:hypothetical protein [Streptomyces sp. F001]RZB19608.1 hypothetical protein StrepF001_12845 [Streptomyces sp. F001]